MFGLGKGLFGGSPRAHRQETGGGRGLAEMRINCGTASGMTAGTMVATALGWRPVEALTRGDLVLTFDRGMQPVKSVERSVAYADPASTPRACQPLMVPAGALGNSTPMRLLPDQPVMLESDTAEMLYGDPFTLLNAGDLDGFRGITRVTPEGPCEAVVLRFENDEVIFVHDGGLLFCGSGRLISIDDILDGNTGADGYRSLDGKDARFLIECIEMEDATGDAPVAPHGESAYAAALAWEPKRA